MNHFDLALVIFWIIMLGCHRAAILPLGTLLVFLVSFESFETNFPIYIITAICHFQCAKTNINVSSHIRQAFLLFGTVYLLGAIDETVYSQLKIETAYYSVMPKVVVAMTAYLALCMYQDGGFKRAGIFSAVAGYFNRCVFWLQLPKACKKGEEKI